MISDKKSMGIPTLESIWQLQNSSSPHSLVAVALIRTNQSCKNEHMTLKVYESALLACLITAVLVLSLRHFGT